jgi:hypothetical protein
LLTWRLTPSCAGGWPSFCDCGWVSLKGPGRTYPPLVTVGGSYQDSLAPSYSECTEGMRDMVGEQEAFTPRQHLALINATETAVFLTVEGLISLDSLDAANDFSHLPLQLLAQGYERLLKVVWSLSLLEQEGHLPTQQQVKEQGHDVVRLTDELVGLCRACGYADQSAAARDDVDFMAHDPRVRELLAVMADIGRKGRYYEIDAFLDPSAAESLSDPRKAFAAVELRVLQAHPEWEARVGKPGFSEFFPRVLNPELTSTLQRFARAVVRLLTLGPAKERGRILTGVVGPFLFLTDEQLEMPPGRWFKT